MLVMLHGVAFIARRFIAATCHRTFCFWHCSFCHSLLRLLNYLRVTFCCLPLLPLGIIPFSRRLFAAQPPSRGKSLRCFYHCNHVSRMFLKREKKIAFNFYKQFSALFIMFGRKKISSLVFVTP